MSNNKMLIDATHPEETRVVVLRDNRVEEFDYESAARKLLRGSIYLAKITRVEPSLQAAFVDYGGNRHGFLAFSEIHPDYYQIPHADRQALLEEELAEQRRLSAEEDEDEGGTAQENAPETSDATEESGEPAPEAPADHAIVDSPETTEAGSAEDEHDTKARLTEAIEANAIDVKDLLPAEPEATAVAEPEHGDEVSNPSHDTSEPETSGDETSAAMALGAAKRSESVISAGATPLIDEPHALAVQAPPEARTVATDQDDGHDAADSNDVESFNDDENDDNFQAVSGDDDEDEAEDNALRSKARARPRRRTRHYKIQEVVKRRQIVLIQVVKEERGNKGAALTTYLSLAGRYTVLMPNTARGGGISRKITNVQDRKRLKAIAQELDVPEGMGLIIRTAGAARTKQEIKRDFEYLLRLWENVRNLTLESTAPSLVYEEGNLIKRSIRDLYTKDIDEIVVAGEEAHKEAKGFMKMLMPSHAKNVLLHADDQSLFAKYRIEQQLNAMFSPVVQLRSGGYLVINQTEALVAVDVNSGKATREFSIEETALNTNLEAAEELSRQLKLRDLAGLIVVDFIDMDEKRNNRAVERKLKDCLKADRARIQVGRISHFGLLEMSRQRLRTGVLEGSTVPCTHCQGSGIVRSTESVSLAVLRGIEDNFLAGKTRSCAALCSAGVAFYLLNQKRAFIQDLERRYGVVIHVRPSDKYQGANFAIDRLSEDVERLIPAGREAINVDTGFEPRKADNDDQTDEATGQIRSRRRRRRGGRRDEARKAENRDEDQETKLEVEDTAQAGAGDDSDGDGAHTAEGDEHRPRRPRRRGRRGGRRHREQRGESALAGVAVPGADQPDLSVDADATPADASAPIPGSLTQAREAASKEASFRAPTSRVETNVEQPTEGSFMGRPERLEGALKEASAPADQPTREPHPESADAPHEEAKKLAAAVEPPSAETPVPASASGEPAEPVAEAKTVVEEVTAATEPASSADAVKESPEADEEQALLETADTDRAARSQPIASKPVVQHVIVGPNGSATSDEAKSDEPEPQPPPASPVRRGWWQRPFGG